VRGQVGLTELTHRLQQGIAGRTTRFVDHDERLVDESQDPVKHFPRINPLSGDDDFSGVDGKRSREHRAAVKHTPLDIVEQFVGPTDGRVERSVTTGRGAIARGQEPQPLVEPTHDVGRSHPPHPGRGELYGQRDVVEALADLDDGGLVVVAQSDVSSHHLGPVHEQLDAVDRPAACARQRGHRPDVFASHPQQRLTGHHHRQDGRRLQHPVDDLGHLGEQVLAVVDHHQGLAGAGPATQGVEHRLSLAFGHAQRGEDGCRHQGPLLQRGEAHEPGPVFELGGDLGGDLEGQARLAHPARTGQRNEPLARDAGGELFHLLGPADEAGALHGQVPGQLVQGPKRWELAGAELPDKHGAAQVPQAMLAQIAKHQAGHELGRHPRDQHLPAVAGGHEPGGAVHRRAEVVAVALVDLAGVDPHPHADAVHVGQGRLGRFGRRHRVGGSPERGREPVPAGGEDVPAVGLDRSSQKPVVLGHGESHRVRVFLPPPGRPLHVGEQERHRP
jgi:hypothetical protein